MPLLLFLLLLFLFFHFIHVFSLYTYFMMPLRCYSCRDIAVHIFFSTLFIIMRGRHIIILSGFSLRLLNEPRVRHISLPTLLPHYFYMPPTVYCSNPVLSRVRRARFVAFTTLLVAQPSRLCVIIIIACLPLEFAIPRLFIYFHATTPSFKRRSPSFITDMLSPPSCLSTLP